MLVLQPHTTVAQVLLPLLTEYELIRYTRPSRMGFKIDRYCGMNVTFHSWLHTFYMFIFSNLTYQTMYSVF